MTGVKIFPELIQYYLTKNFSSVAEAPVFDGSLIDALCEYDWPGNIRELVNLYID